MADKSYKLTLSLSDGSTINAGTITAPQGPNGANGVTFTPSVSAAGVLSWTNNGGLTNPSPISIKGPKGDDAVITESDVKGWGFTKNTGTITEIKMNGVSKGKSDVVDLGTVITDVSDKQNKITSSNKLSSSLIDGLGAAAAKAVDNAISANSTSTNLPTSKAVEDRINAHSGIDKVGTVTSVSVKMNGASKGTVTNSGTIDLGTVITSHQDISGKLDKTTYEVNKTITFGSSGVLYVGKFKVYDTNVTCEVTSTTDVTYSGKLVIATQNYVIKQMTVYGDAANTVAPNFFIKPSTTSDPYIEVYFKPSSWSKNVVHIYGSEIKAEPTNVCTNVPSVPSTATSKPTNALNSKANLSDLPTYSLSGTTLTITL